MLGGTRTLLGLLACGGALGLVSLPRTPSAFASRQHHAAFSARVAMAAPPELSTADVALGAPPAEAAGGEGSAAEAPRKRTRRGSRGGGGLGVASSAAPAGPRGAARPAGSSAAGDAQQRSPGASSNPFNLSAGQCVTGSIKSVAEYGAFVLLTFSKPSQAAGGEKTGQPDDADAEVDAEGGAVAQAGAPAAGAGKARLTPSGRVQWGTTTGLLHISQISGQRVQSVAQVLKPGQKVRCAVLSVNEKGQPKLSTRSLEATPGQMLTDPQAVFDNAPNVAKANRQRASAEQSARAARAESVILGLEDFGEIEHTCRTEQHSNKDSIECVPMLDANGQLL